MHTEQKKQRAQAIKAARRRVLDRRKARRNLPAKPQTSPLAEAKPPGLNPSSGKSREQERRTIRHMMKRDAAATRFQHEGRGGEAWYDVLAHHQEKVSEFKKALLSMGIRGLKVAAAKLNIYRYGRMSKAELVDAIVKAQFTHPSEA